MTLVARIAVVWVAAPVALAAVAEPLVPLTEVWSRELGG